MTKSILAIMIRLVLLLLFYSLNQVASDEFYIIASSTDLCTTPCLTLSQFVNSSCDLLSSDITLVFSPGTHSLNGNLTVSNSDNFAMISLNQTAQIRCARYSQVVFNHSLNVDITNLEFIGCGGIQGLRVDRFVAHNATFRGQGYSGTALEFVETAAQITNCTFSSYRNGQLRFDYTEYGCHQVDGTITANHSSISISQSIFEHNGFMYHYGGAIICLYSSDTTIEESIFEDNTGDTISLYSSSNAKIYNCEFYNNSALCGVLYLWNSNATIEQSIFEDNIGDSISLYSNSNAKKLIYNCEFNNNSALYYGVLYLWNSNATIEQSIFEDNTGDSILLYSSSNAKIHNCEFYNNCASYGVLYLANSNATIEQSIFEDNTGDSISLYSSSNAKIYNCEFYNNSASYGVLYLANSNANIYTSKFYNGASYGVLYLLNSNAKIYNCEFYDNSASYGVLDLWNSNATIEQSIFENNTGNGISLQYGSNAKIYNCEFYNNSESYGIIDLFINSSTTIEKSTYKYNVGTILIAYRCEIRIGMCEFMHNTGSVVLSDNSKVEITTSTFDNNTEAAPAGFPILNEGGILGSIGGSIIVNESNFTNNNSPVIVALSSTIEHYNSLLIMNCAAENGLAVIQLHNSIFIGYHSGNATISDNLRSLIAFNSDITFMGNVKFSNNRQPLSIINNYVQEGGAITLIQSSTYLHGTASFKHNHAQNGGAIFSIGSTFYVKGDVTVAHNMANKSGGGIFLIESELECLNESTVILFNNTATLKGGGIHAISSSIKIISGLPSSAIINFTNNTAERGGGLSLEANAKLVTEKYLYSTAPITYPSYPQYYTTIFSGNSAKYGGAVYVDDDTNSGTCTSDSKTECFFQVLAYVDGLYNPDSIADSARIFIQRNLKPLSMYFTENNASISGSTLYGGLLDRCAVSQSAEVRIKYAEDYKDGGNGIQYLEHVSNITESNTSISSQPVKVCLCTDNEHNCTHKRRIEVKKGETFNVSITSIDQINQPVSGLIHTSFNFAESAVASGQVTREIQAKCTNLTFNVFSPRSSEHLTLYPSDGPCRDAIFSRISLDINFLQCSCPVGLQIVGTNVTNCICECHETIDQYVEECDSNTGTFLRKSQSKAWISFTNITNPSGFLVFPNCPFDYCNFNPSLSLDLNQVNGADNQCAFSRSSLLCGSCQHGLSLSLGSSHCLQCPSYWPVLFISITIAAVLAGIALVALLLVLNMTVAVGTLNGLIFYANVVYANKSILLPFQDTNFITVFVSWLNLELGIDACYFQGMDTFGKTWLQLAFPAYIILLVALVIIISSYSSRFSNLIGKKNPVATLAALILLSYAKLLEVCFKSLSFGNLSYPDGTTKMVWLPDATIEYLSGKHVVLFLTALLTLLVGLVYTALLFSWQWILYLPKWRIFRWSRDQRLQTFIETYHIPFTPKHRYWTGLLLLARAVLYLVAAVNILNDPMVALNAIFIIVFCILSLKAFIGSRVYSKWPVDVLETFFYLNILTFTWYCLGEYRNKKSAAYTSVIIAFIVLLLIILYHVYTYTSIFLKIKITKFGRMIDRQFTDADPKPKPECHGNPPPDDDIHRFHELLDMIDRPVNTNDYEVPLKQQKPVKPTQSVVEVHQPRDLAATDQAEESNEQKVPAVEIDIQ